VKILFCIYIDLTFSIVVEYMAFFFFLELDNFGVMKKVASYKVKISGGSTITQLEEELKRLSLLLFWI
jgi:hypothetical protein